MSVRTRIGHGICLLVALSTVLASHTALLAAPATRNLQPTDDVALQARGELRGQVLDSQGRPLALAKIALLERQRTVGYAKTDVSGRFVIHGVKPGAYQIQSEVGGKTVRVWAPQTAPPAAQQAVLIVADGAVTRAKGEGGTMQKYGPAIRGAVVGGIAGGLIFWAADHNPAGS